MEVFDIVWRNGHLATFDPAVPAPWGIVRDGALAVRDERIVWVGREADLPSHDALEDVDLDGEWLLPGLVDCHTHLVFAGNRADEFERRLTGESYAEIAREGGGIRSTVAATAAASEGHLLELARERAQLLLREGVTTIEVKSGYGSDADGEIRMLRVIRALGADMGVTVRSTFLGLHAVPDPWKGRADAWVDHLVNDVLPVVARDALADQADAFLEDIAFDRAQCRRFLEAARAAGLGLRLHADQLSDGGGAALAAALGARSADHVEYTSDEGVAAMARAGTIAVLLPVAFHVLGETRRPPVSSFRDVGVRMAVASDLNPGSAPTRSVLLAAHLACVTFGLTPEEAMGGLTRQAAAVLGLPDRGVLRPGLRADLSRWAVDHPRDLCYWAGGTPCRASWSAGQPVVSLR